MHFFYVHLTVLNKFRKLMSAEAGALTLVVFFKSS